jgi:PAS domain S-box-containing protein
MRLTVPSRLPVTLLLLAWASVTSSSRSAPSPTRGVVKAGTLQALSTSQAARHVPVQLRGVVTFFDAAEGVLFVQDDSGGALVDTAGLPLDLRPGLEVQVDGVSDSRGGPPLVTRPRVRVVGEAPLPPARRVLASHLKGRSADHEWIEFQGRVALFGEGERSQLLVHEYRDFLRVHVRDLQGREPSSLVGDHMRLRGVYGPVFDEQRRITGYQLWVPAAEHIVHVPAPPTASGLAESLPPRKRVADILNLSPEDAARSFPVSVRGVVTYYDAEWCMLFVQDSTGGIYVQCRSHDFPITTGQLVEVAGVTAPGEYSPIIDRPRLRSLGRAPLPRAETLSADQLAYGRGEARWIRVRGVVQSVHRVGVRHAGFDLAAEGGRRTQVIVPDVDALPSHLLGATVRFRGVGVTIFNNKRQLLGAEVLSPSLAFAEREEAAPPDLLATPVQRVRTLLQFRSGDDPSTRKRVQGIVTYQRPGGSFYLMEQGDGLYVQTTESLPLRAGDRVDVVGFPALGEYTPRFRAAYVRKLAAGEPPEPVSLSAEQALSGDHDAALVRLRGRLLDRAFAAGPALLLQAPPFVFQATLENAERQEFEGLRNGSLLELTGICSVQRDERQVPRSFQVLLRSSADVVVLKSGPWWTRQHTLWAVGLLAFAAPAALGWGALLKRQVRLRTEALRQQSARYRDLVENANDAIYTLDAAGRFTSMNPAGEQMTGYSREEVLSIGLADLVPPEHAARTRERLALEIAAGLPAVHELEVRAKDGRPLALEVSSRPLYEKGRIVGLEGIARDIGERRLAQEIKAQFSAVLEERSRIARELHDSLDQGFWGILLQLEASSEALGGGLSSARTHLELARSLVLHCQTEAHRSVWDLRSTVLDRTDLPNALAAAARLVAVSCSTPVDTKVVGAPRPLPASVENNLLRIGQEAITNAARHSRARAIVAELHFEPGRVRLAVSDDGSGFDVDSTAYAGNGHFGLIGMRERAKRIGGQLTIESVPGAGSTVTVELPTSGDGAP